MMRRIFSILVLSLLLIPPLLSPLPLQAQDTTDSTSDSGEPIENTPAEPVPDTDPADVTPNNEEEPAFPDVSEYDQEAVDYLEENDIVDGYPDGTYKSDNRILKEELTKIVIGAAYKAEEMDKCLEELGEEELFWDTPKDQWFSKYICLAKKEGVISGNPNGAFGIGEYVNFATAAKILAETLNLPVPDENEAEPWFKRYVDSLATEGSIPYSIDYFEQDIDRGEMAEITYRLKTDVVKPSKNYEELNSTFPFISSCSALEDKFRKYYEDQPVYPYPVLYGRGGMLMDGAMVQDEVLSAPAAPSATEPGIKSAESDAANGAGGDFSKTNVQVEGVDEADVVKADGQYIYYVRGSQVTIVKASPAEELSEASEITFTMEDSVGFSPQELYVSGNNLIVIGSRNAYGPMLLDTVSSVETDGKMAATSLIAPYYYKPNTTVKTFDLSDIQNPKEIRSVSYDASYNSSRMIGNYVYLVLSAWHDMWNWEGIQSGNDLVPMFADGAGGTEPMTACDKIRYFPGQETPNYLIISGLDVSDPDSAVSREVFLGEAGNVYASIDNLYVAAQKFDPRSFTDWDWSREADQVKTLAYRFELKNGGVEFAGRGEVPGTILNQFSMDEHEGFFRIATTKGDTWNEQNPSSNNVYTLGVGDMKVVGKLEGLAKGERIYSTRFMGDRLYMVTFKQTDPLFVIDLSSPAQPKLLGELKVPGFSNYLHPYDENHLIGFGYETGENEWGGTTQKGMKLSMFDVGDVANPQEMFTEVIGDQGTYSEVLYNHKALLFEKTGEEALMAFPISVYQKFDIEEGVKCEEHVYDSCPIGCQQQCTESYIQNPVTKVWEAQGDCNGPNSCTTPYYDYYQPTLLGALVYSVDLENGFTKKGEITHQEENNRSEDYLRMIQRIVRISDVLYSLSLKAVEATDLKTMDEIDFLELAGDPWESISNEATPE